MFKRASTGFKYLYTVTFNNCSGLSNSALASVVWKRGAKKENQGETSRKIAMEGSVDWDESITLKCTLFKSKGSGGSSIKFDEKPMLLSVCEYNMKKSKSIPIAKLSVDLSAFAGVSSQTQYHKVKTLKKKGESGDNNSDNIVLSITYHSESIGEEEGVSETDNIDVNDLDKEDYDGEDPFADPEDKDSTYSPPSSSATDKSKESKDKTKSSSFYSSSESSSKKHSHSKHKEVTPKAPELAALTESVAALEKNVETLKDELKAAKAENASLQRQVESLETSIRENGADESQQALVASYKAKAAESGAAAQQLRKDNAELRERVEKLEKDLKVAKTDGKKLGKKSKQRGSDDADADATGEVAALREQVAALSRANAMTIALYEAAATAEFGQDGVPRAATKMKEWLTQGDGASGSALFEPIFRCAQPLYSAVPENSDVSFYWVSTYYSLLRLVAGSDRLRPRISAQENNGDNDGQGGSSSSSSPQRGIVSTIEYELYESFLAALCSCYKHVDEYVVFRPEGATAGTGLPKIRTQELIAAISASLKAAEKARLPDSVRVQVCEHLVACIDAGIFNELVSKPELCTCGMGLHIREALGEIEDFLSRDTLMFQAKRHLSHVREASCLFIMDKNILNDDDTIKSAICALNYRQVSKLLENFHEDQFCTTKVDAPILQLMRGRARTAESASIMLDPHKFLN